MRKTNFKLNAGNKVYPNVYDKDLEMPVMVENENALKLILDEPTEDILSISLTGGGFIRGINLNAGTTERLFYIDRLLNNQRLSVRIETKYDKPVSGNFSLLNLPDEDLPDFGFDSKSDIFI